MIFHRLALGLHAGAQEVLLFPVIVMMLVLGGLIVLGQSSAVAPMIYTIF